MLLAEHVLKEGVNMHGAHPSLLNVSFFSCCALEMLWTKVKVNKMFFAQTTATNNAAQDVVITTGFLRACSFIVAESINRSIMSVPRSFPESG
jgi:hypothetical protein